MSVGNVLVTRDRRISLKENQMVISNLKRSDTGTYKCELAVDPPKELIHNLEVLYAPEIKAVTQGEQLVRKGNSISLECQAKGNPTPIIKWTQVDGRHPTRKVEGEASYEV